MQRSIRVSGQDLDMLRDLLDQEKSAVGIDLKDVLRGPRGRYAPGAP
jgi:hypothetical protein